MATIEYAPADAFELSYPVIVIGGGGCGLCAALAVRDAGIDVLVVERDRTPLGTTSMSTGLIPAAGTPEQRERGLEDSPEQFTADVMAKTDGEANETIVRALAETSAETISWLRDTHGVNLNLLDDFLYPGHTQKRMYGMPNRSGQELMAALADASFNAGVDVLTEALVEKLYRDETGKITGIGIERPDGSSDRIGCNALILACCGFAGDPDMVAKYIPEMKNATFHGHPGNKGHAIEWGEHLGAQLSDMTGYQGHGGLAYGHGIPILWPLIMEGGIQVNALGERFSDETKGYSEQAMKILQQPGSVAWSVYSEPQHTLMLNFDDYRDALSAGAVNSADTLEQLADVSGLPADGLKATIANATRFAERQARDPFGRDFSENSPLRPKYYIAKVTGALFHTQGGLEVDTQARVLDTSGRPFPNLFAGGGAARGISGSGASGYMAGNGLLTATSLGKIAGRTVASLVS